MEQKKMKRVLMLLKSSQYAGAEKVVIDIMRNLKKEYIFYYSSPDGKIAAQLKKYHLKYVPLRCFSMQEVYRVIHLVRPDIIHAHDFSASVAAAVFKSPGGRQKLISHIHYNAKENQAWGKKAILYAVILPRIDCVISVSKAVVEEAVFQKVLKSKVRIVGNPIDKAEIRQKAECWGSWQKAECSDIAYDIIFVGRLCEQKNPQKFIHIIQKLLLSGERIHAAMIGEGELYEECKQLLEQYQLQSQVTMLGFLDNPYPVMKNSKILCMTSKEEGFGLAVAEAMVLGIPVLVSNVGGMKELLGEGAEEFCESEEEYVKKIKRLLHDPEFYQKEQEQMRKKASSFPDRLDYMEKIRILYKNVQGYEDENDDSILL